MEASLWLLVSRLALIFVPFPRIAARLGTYVSPRDSRVGAVLQQKSDDEIRQAEAIGWAVRRAADHVPFRAVCLPQAMAARIMLKRRGVDSVLHFGATKTRDKPLEAHAWLDAAGVEVTGYPVARDFTEIACFV